MQTTGQYYFLLARRPISRWRVVCQVPQGRVYERLSQGDLITRMEFGQCIASKTTPIDGDSDLIKSVGKGHAT